MKLLVTDYDNTLELHYDYTDNNAILKRNLIALNKFMQNNIVCIATGRHFNAIYETLLENNIKFNYLCSNNGAELYNKNYNLLFCLPIAKYDIEVLKKLGEKVIFRNAYNSKLIPSANLYFDNLEEYNKTKEYLQSNLKHSFVEYKYPKIKVINKKCNKLNVIEIINTLEEISEENIYTIGDDVNDIEMILKYNGSSLATAKEEVKKISLKIYDELNQLISDIN